MLQETRNIKNRSRNDPAEQELDCPYNTVTRLLKYYNTKAYHSTESTQSLSGVLDPEALAPYHPKSEIPHGFFAGEKMIRTGVG